MPMLKERLLRWYSFTVCKLPFYVDADANRSRQMRKTLLHWRPVAMLFRVRRSGVLPKRQLSEIAPPP